MPEFGNRVWLLLLTVTVSTPDPESVNAIGEGASGSVTDWLAPDVTLIVGGSGVGGGGGGGGVVASTLIVPCVESALVFQDKPSCSVGSD